MSAWKKVIQAYDERAQEILQLRAAEAELQAQLANLQTAFDLAEATIADQEKEIARLRAEVARNVL